MSWIRCQGRLLDKPEHLVEASVRGVFNSQCWKHFACILGEVGDMESEWAVFRAFIVEAAAVVQAVKLKEETFWA